MTTMSDIYDPIGQQDLPAIPAGQDEVENGDHYDNLQDADTPADLNGLESSAEPGFDSTSDEEASPLDDNLDDQTDGDRQLTTGSDAIDTGLNDSDLGADVAGLAPDEQAALEREGYAGLGPDAPRTGGDPTGDRATGLMGTRE